MITVKQISDFFDLEFEAQKKDYEQRMKLTVEQRVQQGRAIAGVTIAGQGKVIDNFNVELLLEAAQNMSDFKVGDKAVLHHPSQNPMSNGVQCEIVKIDDEGGLVVNASRRQLRETNLGEGDSGLALDKQLVDLRRNVYAPFIEQLSQRDVEQLAINSGRPATIGGQALRQAAAELDDTCRELNWRFTAAQRQAVERSMAASDYYLIQGPPGTGKSHVLGAVILQELVRHNRHVMVTGPNHMAVNNLLAHVVNAMPQIAGQVLKVGQYYNAPAPVSLGPDDPEVEINNLEALGNENVQHLNGLECGWLVGSTVHSLYTKRCRGLQVDVLIIDEAGQMSVPLALMGMIQAPKVIFAGDHKQLAPIIAADKVAPALQGSVFEALMRPGSCTMLDESFRMCSPICDFVSSMFYQGMLRPHDPNLGTSVQCGDPLLSMDHPVVLRHISHNSRQQSQAEAQEIAAIVAQYIAKGVPAGNMAVLSPFRAQGACVRQAMRRQGGITAEQARQVVADTVDRMQGQEREIIIFSLTASDPAYVAELQDFLYNPNKLNVAFSRAKHKLIVVGDLEALSARDSAMFPHIATMLASPLATRL